MTAAPERIETERLLLRRPVKGDARAIFQRYASDPAVTRYLAWPRHQSIEDTLVFVEFSDAEWTRWRCGPYLAFSRADGALLGSSGLMLEGNGVASTGYVFARDAWGVGYATETLAAMIALAASLECTRLYAMCHPDHDASRRVMEKCGMSREARLPRHALFPNLSRQPQDVLVYAQPVAS